MFIFVLSLMNCVILQHRVVGIIIPYMYVSGHALGPQSIVMHG